MTEGKPSPWPQPPETAADQPETAPPSNPPITDNTAPADSGSVPANPEPQAPAGAEVPLYIPPQEGKPQASPAAVPQVPDPQADPEETHQKPVAPPPDKDGTPPSDPGGTGPGMEPAKAGGLRARWAAMSPTDRTMVKVAAPLLLLLLLCFALIPLINAANQTEMAALLEMQEEEETVEEEAPEPFAINDSRFLRTGEVVLSGVRGMTKSQLEESITISPRAQFVCYTDRGSTVLYIAQHRNIEYKVTLHDYDAGTSQSAVINEDPLTVHMVNSTSSLRLDGSIILEFSHPVSEEEARKYISIHALYGGSVAYTMEVEDKTVTLTPNSLLEFDTDYYVEVGALRSLNNKQLYGGADIDFSTMNYNFKLTLTNPEAQLIAESQELVLEFETINRYRERTAITINIYRFESLQKYADQAYILTDYDLELDILERVETHIDLLPSQLHQLELEMPGQGAYLIEAIAKNPSPGPFDQEEYRFRKAVCVTDLSLYLQTVRDQTLAWLNHSATGQALEGYRIEFATGTKNDAAVSTTTNPQGVGTFQYTVNYNDDEARPEQVRIYNPAGELVYIDNTQVINQYYGGGYGDLYYSFFYADRAIYQPTDEINFWGYVRSYRTNGTPAPSQLDIVFDPGGLNIRTTVSVDAYGSFNGTLQLEQVKSSQYVIQVQIPSGEDEEQVPEEDYYYDYYGYGSGVLDRCWIDVKEYEKPTYVLSSNTDKLFYRWDEEVTVSVTPAFFDGTPLPYYDLEFSVYSGYYGSEGAVQIITTDETGVATVSFPAYQLGQGGSAWGPLQNRYQVRLASDGQNLTHNGSYYYFPADTMLVGTLSDGGENGPALTVNTHEITLAAITSQEAFYSLYPDYSYYSGYYSPERHNVLRGDPKDMRVEAQVEFSIYNIFGTYTSKEYTTTLDTVNGTAVLSELITEPWLIDYHASVDVTLIIQDGQGHRVTYNCYWYNSSARYGHYGSGEREKAYPPGYSLAVENNLGEDMLDEYYDYYTYNTMSAGDGETMTFTLLLDGEPVPNQGRILYSLIQNEIVDQGIVTSDAFTLTQRVEYANSITVVAAYFDGGQVHTVRDTYVSFDRASVQMTLEVSADQPVYRPGDSVTLTLRATDPDGNGVAGNALLSVVDEAVFAVKEQYTYLLSDLYGDMNFYNTYVRKYTTTTGDVGFRDSSDGGKGDGDSLSFYDSYRKDFKDTAAFLPVRTDQNGYATVSFTLPDNTTSWRITSLGIGDNLYGGQQKDNIISTLPFFINPVVSSKYIEGDEVALLVQGHGTLLDEETEIEYTVRLFGEAFDDTITLESSSFEPELVSFGTLPTGEYTLVATARFSGYSDTVELPVVVIPSNIELVINRDLDLSRPLELGAMRYPVVLTFYDRENEPFFRTLNDLLTRSSYRIDQSAGRIVARQALTSYMDPEDIPQYILNAELDLWDYQNSDGGMGWYRGGSSDPGLTARLLLLFPDQFDQGMAASYLREELRYTRDGKVRGLSYLGLAAAGEPVAEEVEERLAKGDALLGERLYLIAALAVSGETDRALELYQAEVTPRLINADRDGRYLALSPFTRTIPGAYMLRQDEDQFTATAWLIASYLGLADADDFALYFSTGGWRVNSQLESMMYVSWYSKEIPSRSFTYTVDGQSRTVDLGVSGRRSIRFTKSQLEALSLTQVPEGLVASAYYIGSPEEADFQPSENFTVEKTIEEIQPGRYTVEITVRFGESAPTGYYDISEWIPSNMRLYDVNTAQPEDTHAWASWWNENQKIYFSINRYRKDCDVVTVRYTAQQTFDSAAMIDRTYVIHSESGQAAMTEKWVLGE